MKKLLLALLLVLVAPGAAYATDLRIVCPSACTVTLPATTWDEIGGALNDAIKVRQDLYGELSRQIREQLPKTEPTLSSDVSPKAPPAP